MNNVQFVSTLKLLCKEKGITISSLLETCSLRKSLIYDVEKRNAKPSIEIVENIADQLDCSIDYLLGRTDNPNITYSIQKPERKISLYEKPVTTTSVVMEDFASYKVSKGIAILGKVAAGTPILSYEVDFGNIIPENPSASYALIAQGDSMHPVIHDKETIEVISQKNLENGEIGIISVDGSMTCKKFYDFKDHYELRSINPDYPTMHIEKNPSTNLQIRGKVSLTRAQNSRL